MKKKLTAMAGVMVLLVVLSTQALAVRSANYHIDEIGLSLDIPASFVVFTRDMDENDPAYTDYRFSYDMIADYFSSNSALCATSLRIDNLAEIFITCESSSLQSLIGLDNKALDELSANLAELYKSSFDVSNFETELYVHNSIIYIKANYTQVLNGSRIAKIQYYTVYNSQAINIVYISYSGATDTYAESMMKGVIDSITYDDPQRSEPITADTPNIQESKSSHGTEPTVWYKALVASILAVIASGFSLIFGKKKKTAVQAQKRKESNEMNSDNGEAAAPQATRISEPPKLETGDGTVQHSRKSDIGALLIRSNVDSRLVQPKAIRFCRFCGEKIPPDSQFCQYCGKEFF